MANFTIARIQFRLVFYTPVIGFIAMMVFLSQWFLKLIRVIRWKSRIALKKAGVFPDYGFCGGRLSLHPSQ